MVRRTTTLLAAIACVVGATLGARHLDRTAEPADVAGGYTRAQVMRIAERGGLVTPYLPTTLPHGYFLVHIGESVGNDRMGQSTSSLFAGAAGAPTVEVCARPVAEQDGCENTARSFSRRQGPVLVRIRFIVSPGEDLNAQDVAFWRSVRLVAIDSRAVGWLGT